MYVHREDHVTPPTLECYADAREALSADPASEIAALLIEHVRESRQSNLEQTRAEEHQLRLAHAAQIKALRTEAHELRDAAKWRGMSQVASGALTIGSGLVAASSSTGDTSTDGPQCATACTPIKDQGIDLSNVIEGGAKGVGGAGELVAVANEHQGRLAGTRATEHEHQGGESERRLKTLDEARSQALELQRTAFEHLQKLQETRAGTDQAATTWRG